MLIHHPNIVVVTRSNFEVRININGPIFGVIDPDSSIDVVSVRAGVNVAVVKLGGGRREKLRA